MLYLKSITGVLLTAAFLIGCNPLKQAPQGSQAQATEPSVAVNPANIVVWAAEGVIMPNEYANYQKVGELDVYTRVKEDVVYMAIAAQTTGWVAIGIDPEKSMKGADIIMGAIIDNQPVLMDMYATGPFGPHPADTQQGGANDISEGGGTEQNGVTVIEFKRKLNTGDSKDKSLKPGENKVMWAIGETDDLTMKHGRRGMASLLLQ